MKKINNILIIVLLVVNTCYLLYLFQNDTEKILVTLSFYLTIFIPKIMKKLKIKIPNEMEFVYLIFLFLAQFLGSTVGLYKKIYWYDSFTHFISGILTSFLALAVLLWYKIYNKKNINFNSFFMIAFSLMIASLWEFFEFTVDKILKTDTQRVLTTGVNDTMKDMLVAFLGAILTVIYYIYTKNKKNIFSNFENEIENKGVK